MSRISISNRRILVTGANGFIGKNLVLRLKELANITVRTFERGDDAAFLPQMVSQVNAVVHLAGVNRSADEVAFAQVNAELTAALCKAIERTFRSTGRHVPLILASSTQAERDNPYGRSKLAAEAVVQAFAEETGNPCVIFRLPGVFGKWCKPNYNSVVATLCHNIARDLPIHINDAVANLRLVYIDDVLDEFLRALDNPLPGWTWGEVLPGYTISLGDLADQILAFKNCRTTLMSERVGTGLIRALYSTYVSYLPPERFYYNLPQYGDERGMFIEMLKTPDCGQFSFFTVNPGMTRGSHYHHSKTEKFLVVKGVARIRYRHIVTGEIYEFTLSGTKPQVLDSIPGWVHDITNVGEGEVMVMLWANEVFERQLPDCIPCKV